MVNSAQGKDGVCRQCGSDGDLEGGRGEVLSFSCANCGNEWPEIDTDGTKRDKLMEDNDKGDRGAQDDDLWRTTNAVCDQCGGSHADGACWDEDAETTQRDPAHDQYVGALDHYSRDGELVRVTAARLTGDGDVEGVELTAVDRVGPATGGFYAEANEGATDLLESFERVGAVSGAVDGLVYAEPTTDDSAAWLWCQLEEPICEAEEGSPIDDPLLSYATGGPVNSAADPIDIAARPMFGGGMETMEWTPADFEDDPGGDGSDAPVGSPVLDNALYRSLLNNHMCADPWPLSDDAQERFEYLLNREAERRGHTGWVEAYHAVNTSPAVMPEPGESGVLDALVYGSYVPKDDPLWGTLRGEQQ